jgi:membrane protein implicated in regulation of membrane protease activity
MVEWIQNLSPLEQSFFGCASVGGVLFLIQLVLMFLGGDANTDMSAEAGDSFGHGGLGGDTDVSGDAHHPSSDVSFKLLSYQGLTAFFMMFGLVGLAMRRGSELGAAISTLAAAAAGFLSMLGVAKLFQFFLRLQSSGTINMVNAVGKTGRVYLRIKPNSKGQIEVAFQGRLRICDAMSADKEEIPTDAQVEVTRVEGAIMIVKRIS